MDQPVGTGFSYDTLVQSTVDLLFSLPASGLPTSLSDTGTTAFEEYDGDVPPQNTTFLHGILPSQNPLHTANSTSAAATTLWHFAQVWFADFPEWQTSDKRVSLCKSFFMHLHIGTLLMVN